MPGVRHTSNTKKAVIRNFAHCGRVDEACRLAGVNRENHYRWLKTDPKYKEQFDEARELAMDALEDEVYLRAREGVWRPVFHQGVQVASVREHSDTLAIFLLKSHRPKIFNPRIGVDLTGNLSVTNVVDQILNESTATDID